jgi:hypothetical protein
MIACATTAAFSCGSQNSGDVSKDLADKLTDSMDFQNGTKKAGTKPLEHAGDTAYPQVTNVLVEQGGSLYETTFTWRVEYTYGGPVTEITGAIVHVASAYAYFDVKQTLTEQGQLAVLTGTFKAASDSIIGKSFTIEVALYNASGAGNYYTNLTITPQKGTSATVDPIAAMNAFSFGSGSSTESFGGNLPAGEKDSIAAPQISGQIGMPAQVRSGELFDATIPYEYSGGQPSALLFQVKGAGAYLKVPLKAGQIANGKVTVPMVFDSGAKAVAAALVIHGENGSAIRGLVTTLNLVFALSNDKGKSGLPVEKNLEINDDSPLDGGFDAGTDAGQDAGSDAGKDGGFDAGVDSGVDGGITPDASMDAGIDASADAGTDAGVDGGQDAGADGGSTYCLTSQCFAVPPTGQNKCYNNGTDGGIIPCPANRTDPFWGQDAQFQKTRTLTCSGGACSTTETVIGEIVTDSLTGLIWQRALPTTYAGCTGGTPTGTGCTFQQAIDYCANLDYGSKQDWRLPNPIELASIIDNQVTNPATDLTAFPGTPAKTFWTSSPVSYNSADAWYLYFTNGSVSNGGKTSYFNSVRCVRGGPGSAGSASSAFLNLAGSTRYTVTEPVPGEQVVADATTGLMWEGDISIEKNWQQALSYCATLNFGGHQDWRLPNKNELISLMNYSVADPVSDFPGITADYAWSSTTSLANFSQAWLVYFDVGYVSYQPKTYQYTARCVRGGP